MQDVQAERGVLLRAGRVHPPAIIALAEGWIPANLGAEPSDPELRIRVNTSRAEQRSRVVMSNSFGFGGSNAAVLLGAA